MRWTIIVITSGLTAAGGIVSTLFSNYIAISDPRFSWPWAALSMICTMASVAGPILIEATRGAAAAPAPSRGAAPAATHVWPWKLTTLALAVALVALAVFTFLRLELPDLHSRFEAARPSEAGILAMAVKLPPLPVLLMGALAFWVLWVVARAQSWRGAQQGSGD